MKTTKRALTAAVLLSCACFMAPFYAHAADHEEGYPVNPHTPNYIELSVNGQNFARFDVYDNINDSAGYWTGNDDDKENFRTFFTPDENHTSNEKDAMVTSMKYIVDMVGAPANTLNMNLKLCEPADADASAESPTWIQLDANGKPIQISDSELTATYLGKMDYNKNNGVAEITVNEANNWYTEKFPVLPSNGTNSDYYGTITHEMFHAMGLGTYIREVEIEYDDKRNAYFFGTDSKDNDDDVEVASKNNIALTNDNPDGTVTEIVPSQDTTIVFNKYEMGLRDAFGRVAYYEEQEDSDPVYYDGAKFGAKEPIDPNSANPLAGVNGKLVSREIVSITLDEYNAWNTSFDPNKFYVINKSNDIPTSNGGVYFTGTNVQEVLNGAQIAQADDSSKEFPIVPGLPINGFEGSAPELSHIELQNSLMSHQSYRNWCTFMEAEIALLQDLGYTIDRSKYFGKSIYNSGTEGALFKVNNNIAFDSDQMHGIGLHVYGSYVDVTQNADINANGDYGIGIRVDGVGNKVTINSNVSANGEGGNGLLVAYGKEHTITLNAGKTIEATGTDGVAARFDFGSNELGDEFEYRGSYFSVSYEAIENEEPSEGSGDGNTPVDGTSSGNGNTSDDGTSSGNGNTSGSGNTSGNGNTSSGDLAENDSSIIQEEIPQDEEKEKTSNEQNPVARLQNITDSTEQTSQPQWIKNPLPEAINGELVTNFNVAGTLKGKKAAIYISPNAFVKNINITNGADIQGDIISEWNPQAIYYQNEDSESALAPNLPSGEDGITKLTFGLKIEDGQPKDADSDFTMTYSGKIQGENSIDMHVSGGELDYNGTANVKSLYIMREATLKGTGSYELGTHNNRGYFYNDGTFDLGEGISTISIKGNYVQTGGNLLVDFNTNNESDKLNISEGNASINGGTITLTPQVDYYYNGQKITISVIDVENGYNITNQASAAPNNISPVLKFEVNESESKNASTDKETKYVIDVSRVEQGYQSVATDDISSGIGSAIDIDSQKKKDDEQYVLTIDKQKLLTSLDYPLTITNTDAEKNKVVSNNLKKLNPNVVGSQAQAVIETHTTLNNLVSTVSSLNVGSMSMNTPVSRRIGGLGPNRVEPPKYNSWRNIVIPFSSYTDQHNGTNGYTNHNSGVIGAMERTFANGLTHGYHAAINHQSTEDSGSTIKGEGIYFGTHASYAPVEWNGWSVFGSARLGVEQMRSHRRVYISDSLAPYYGTADGDWTGYSGSFNIGAALTKEHGVVKSGPFAALDYSFAHRPSVHEDGGAVRTNLESATYDSLRTQLGYRLVTNPKPLDSYDSTQWQAHASVAWNHELLSDNGRTSYQLAEFPGTPIEDTIETYGRDSMSIAAGVIFKTPNRLDVGLTIGSDIYRKGGSSIYGKATFEWKF